MQNRIKRRGELKDEEGEKDEEEKEESDEVGERERRNGGSG